MTMKGEPVPPEGLDHIKSLQKWLEQHPNDVMVRSKLAEFPVPPGLKKYIDATRIVAGASVPTSAACIVATFNLAGCRRYRRSEQSERSASIRPVLCSRLGERLEEERVVPGNHEGPRGGRRTGGRPPP